MENDCEDRISEPALSGWAVSIERITGGVVVFFAAAIVILAIISPVEPPEITPLSLDADREMSIAAMSILGIIAFSGLIILLSEARRIFSPGFWSAPNGAPCGIGIWDFFKALSMQVVSSNVILMFFFPLGINREEGEVYMVSLAAYAVMLAYMLAILRIKQVRLADFGIRFNGLTRLFRQGLGAYLAFMPLYFGLVIGNVYLVYLAKKLAGYEGDVMPVQSSIEFMASDRGTFFIKAVLGVYVVLGAPIVEEICFRGILFNGLKRFAHWIPAAILCGAVFGIAHGLAFALPLGMLGAYLAVIREKTGTLLVPIVIHATFNGVVMVVLYMCLL